jgi:hypothetical protein
MASCSAANPQVWNSGGAMNIGSPAWNGIRDRIAPAGAQLFGLGRSAPLGVPVVPEVNTISLP